MQQTASRDYLSAALQISPEPSESYYRARYYDQTAGRFISEDPIGFSASTNFYRYVGNDPQDRFDPLGLWGVQFGNVNIGSGDPTLLFNRDSWGYFGQSLAATADGVIPFFDPFQKFYDPCDRALQLSRSLGAAARNVALSTLIPNLPVWAENPVLYEVGSTTVPSQVYNAMQGLNAVQKGSYLLSNFGVTGTARLSLQALRAGEFAKTIGTGLTPGGWLLVIGAGQALDSRTHQHCECKQ